MEATFSGGFLGRYKVIKIGYGLFSYALQPAKRTSTSLMGAILKKYLVAYVQPTYYCREEEYTLCYYILNVIIRKLFKVYSQILREKKLMVGNFYT